MLYAFDCLSFGNLVLYASYLLKLFFLQRQLNLLSFGEEAEEEKVLATVKDKIKSIHDELDDPRFPMEELEKKVGIAKQSYDNLFL